MSRPMQEALYQISRTPGKPFFVRVRITWPVAGLAQVQPQFSAWRPGRYELANYPKNVTQWHAQTAGSQPLPWAKVQRNTWQVATQGAEVLVVEYDYYARQLDSGACYADAAQVYLNPVNCCMFVPELMHLPCHVEFDLDASYIVGCSMEALGPHSFKAKDWEELADSPVIASPTLQHAQTRIAGIPFHFWIQGLHNLDVPRFVADTEKYAALEIATMGGMPSDRYHFLFQFVNQRQYHGVEHLHNTVITLGPGFNMDAPASYADLLGVSCHELFHVWNIKTIRPEGMLPYDYTKENYSTLGYVYEGVTTYYGHLFLVRAGVYTVRDFLNELGDYLKKHTHSFGRYNYSVAQSSFDTWVDGYAPSSPDRKTSIYTEGLMAAMIADLRILKATKNARRLDDVMRTLYHDYALQNKPYTEAIYKGILEAVSGQDWSAYFAECIHRADLLLEKLREELAYVGCTLMEHNAKWYERLLGFTAMNMQGRCMVNVVAPGSPAMLASLADDDEIVALNGVRIENNLAEQFECAMGAQAVELAVFDAQKRLRTVRIPIDHGNAYFTEYAIHMDELAGANARAAFSVWAGQAQEGF